MFNFFYKRPQLLYSLLAAFIFLGLIGFMKMQRNFFPDAEYPQVFVITQVPGATAETVSSTVSKVLEEEIYTLANIRSVSSTNIAGMSVVRAEFDYSKELGEAAVYVNNALNRVRSRLPEDAAPSIYTSGAFNAPVDVFTLTPENNTLTLADVRKIAESDIKRELLKNKYIGNVEIFGGYKGAVSVDLDPMKMRKYSLVASDVIKVISNTYKDIPMGFLQSEDNYITVNFYGEEVPVGSLSKLPVKSNVKLKDVAEISWGYEKNRSAYMGNAKSGIAVIVKRPPGGSIVDASNAAREIVGKLKNRFNNISFSISDTQKNLVDTSLRNMFDTLKLTIIIVVFVILLFLANIRATLASAVTIPIIFFISLGVIWITGGELNIVVMTAIVLALGLVVDDSVVVIENIERHFNDLNKPIDEAVKDGTKEVTLASFSGTLTTVIAVFPLMFVGGFPEKIFKPLAFTLIIALSVSYFLSITFIPRIFILFYKNGAGQWKIEKLLNSFYFKTFDKLKLPYISMLKFTKKSHFRKIFIILIAFALIIVSGKNIVPVIGRDVMPPMDTGIIKVQVSFSSNLPARESLRRIKGFTEWLHKQPEVRKSSVSIGSEPGVLAMGNGALSGEANIIIHLTNRFDRDASMWDVEERIRKQLSHLSGAKYVNVYDYGATPFSSIKAPVVTRIKAEDFETLPKVASKVRERMMNVKGINSVDINWNNDMKEVVLDINENKLAFYGLTGSELSRQLALKGVRAGAKSSFSSIKSQGIKVYYNKPFDESIQSLSLLPIKTEKGFIALSQIGDIKSGFTPAKITREDLLYSIDVNGYTGKRPVSIVTSDVKKKISELDTAGYKISQEGNITALNDSFKRMSIAMGITSIFLLIALYTIYKSMTLALIMIPMLPLSAIGAFWALLFFNKLMCLPAMVGFLLLFGIILNNAILLVDFYRNFKSEYGPFGAAVESVKVRFRPVLMTAVSTIAGMIPLALEMAVGLERVSPLADVAIGGLLIGTVITLVFIPMFCYWFESKKTNTE